MHLIGRSSVGFAVLSPTAVLARRAVASISVLKRRIASACNSQVRERGGGSDSIKISEIQRKRMHVSSEATHHALLF